MEVSAPWCLPLYIDYTINVCDIYDSGQRAGSGVAPVAYQVIILEPGIGQFREFEPRRVHKFSYKFVGTFSCGQIDLRKARGERELATLDEQSTSSGIAEPYAR